MGRHATAAALLAAFLATACRAQILNPPYFNLAEGRTIWATATCGDSASPELYCKLVGANLDKQDNPHINLIQGQVCDHCDGTDPRRAHPPENAIDGSEHWWQSPPLSRGTRFNEVNLTIDLGQASASRCFPICVWRERLFWSAPAQPDGSRGGG